MRNRNIIINLGNELFKGLQVLALLVICPSLYTGCKEDQLFEPTPPMGYVNFPNTGLSAGPRNSLEVIVAHPIRDAQLTLFAYDHTARDFVEIAVLSDMVEPLQSEDEVIPFYVYWVTEGWGEEIQQDRFWDLVEDDNERKYVATMYVDDGTRTLPVLEWTGDCMEESQDPVFTRIQGCAMAGSPYFSIHEDQPQLGRLDAVGTGINVFRHGQELPISRSGNYDQESEPEEQERIVDVQSQFEVELDIQLRSGTNRLFPLERVEVVLDDTDTIRDNNDTVLTLFDRTRPEEQQVAEGVEVSTIGNPDDTYFPGSWRIRVAVPLWTIGKNRIRIRVEHAHGYVSEAKLIFNLQPDFELNGQGWGLRPLSVEDKWRFFLESLDMERRAQYPEEFEGDADALDQFFELEGFDGPQQGAWLDRVMKVSLDGLSPYVDDCALSFCVDSDGDGLLDTWENIAAQVTRPNYGIHSLSPREEVTDPDFAWGAYTRVTPHSNEDRREILMQFLNAIRSRSFPAVTSTVQYQLKTMLYDSRMVVLESMVPSGNPPRYSMWGRNSELYWSWNRANVVEIRDNFYLHPFYYFDSGDFVPQACVDFPNGDCRTRGPMFRSPVTNIGESTEIGRPFIRWMGGLWSEGTTGLHALEERGWNIGPRPVFTGNASLQVWPTGRQEGCERDEGCFCGTVPCGFDSPMAIGPLSDALLSEWMAR